MTQEGGDEDLARQLQPHLSSPAAQHDPPTAHDADVHVSVDADFLPAHTQTSSSQRVTWETFDDDSGGRPAPRESPASQPAADSEGRSGSGQAAGGHNAPAAANDATPAPEAAATTTMAAAAVVSPPAVVSSPGAAVVPPVAYNHRSGKVVVVASGGDGVDGQGAGGVIQTRHTSPPPNQGGGLHDTDEPLRPSRIRMLKILSVAAAVLFFPTGIPAAVLAWRVRGQFNEGVLQGNIDRALRTARHCRRLCIASLVLAAVVAAALILGLLKRRTYGTGDHSFIAHDPVHGW